MVLADIALVWQIAGAVLLAAVSYRWVERPVRTGSARAWLDARTPRRRSAIALGTIVALAATVAAAGARTPDRPPASPLATTRSAAARAAPTPAAVQAPLKPLAVGASVMLAASPELEQDSWERDVNRTLKDAARNWPQARLVDWYKASDRPGLLYDDDIHPVPRGQRAYARLIERALD